MTRALVQLVNEPNWSFVIKIENVQMKCLHEREGNFHLRKVSRTQSVDYPIFTNHGSLGILAAPSVDHFHSFHRSITRGRAAGKVADISDDTIN